MEDHPLSRYAFVDKEGHLIEHCSDYLVILEEITYLRRELLWLQSPEFFPVVSSNIAAVAYNEKTELLRVQFKGGGDTYTYEAVPRAVFNELLLSESKGSFLNTSIKGIYEFRRDVIPKSLLG